MLAGECCWVWVGSKSAAEYEQRGVLRYAGSLIGVDLVEEVFRGCEFIAYHIEGGLTHTEAVARHRKCICQYTQSRRDPQPQCGAVCDELG